MTGSNSAKKIGILCLGVPYFGLKEAQAFLNQTVGQLQDDFNLVGPRKVIIDRKTLLSALEKLRKEDLAAALVQIGTFPDGEAPALVAEHLNVPIVAHGLPEVNPTQEIATNSMCGLAMTVYTLRALNYPHTWVLGAPADPAVIFRLKSDLKGALALLGLRRNPIGLIGYRAPGFFPSAFDELLLRRRLGVAIEHIGLNEFTAALQTAPRRKARRDSFPTIEGGVLPAEVVERIERNYAALLAVLDKSSLHTFAMKDWPELFDADTPGGLWPALGWIQADGYTIAPEGDVSGAVTMALAQGVGDSPSFFCDISALDEPNSTLTLWHYGAPESLAKADDQIRYGSEGREVQFTLAPGQATLVRLGHDHGDLRILTIAVEVLDVPTRLGRASAVVRTTCTPAGQVMTHMLDHGWDHHVCLAYGDQTEAFRAIGKFTGISVESL